MYMLYEVTIRGKFEEAPWLTFSTVIGLVYLLYKGTIELDFENLCLCPHLVPERAAACKTREEGAPRPVRERARKQLRDTILCPSTRFF